MCFDGGGFFPFFRRRWGPVGRGRFSRGRSGRRGGGCLGPGVFAEFDVGQRLAFRAKYGGDVLRHFDAFLSCAPGELAGVQLGQDFLQWQFDGCVIPVRGVGEDTRRGRLPEFAEGNPHAPALKLREDLVQGHTDLNTSGGGLADLGFEYVR